MQNNQPATLTIQKTVRLAVLNVCLILLMTSCGANWHLKRAIAKDPTILQKEIVKLDTVIVTKERVLVDTLELYRDTTIIQDGVKVRVDYIDRFVTIKADCPSDTIFLTKEVMVDKIVYNKKEDNTKFILALLLASAFALLYLSKVMKSL